MLYNYFSKLGIVTYKDTAVNNIITSIRFKDVLERTKATFYPYVIKEGQRPDHIAYDYYDDSRYAWLVLLSNRIIDPYYQWPLSLNEFNKYIIKKYGSVESAILYIAFFRNNYDSDETILSPEAYQALPTNSKKYYKEITGYDGAITGYDRRSSEMAVESNKTIEIPVNSTTGLIIGERITQKTNGVITGSATVKAILTNKLVCTQVIGTFSTTTGSVGSIVGYKSNVSRSCTDTPVTISSAIPDTEAVYFNAVSVYDYENEINESRKSINLLDKDYILQIEDQIRELMT